MRFRLSLRLLIRGFDRDKDRLSDQGVFQIQGGADQKVLVQDYNTGKNIAFNGGSRNVKEVIAMDGTKMYVLRLQAGYMQYCYEV